MVQIELAIQGEAVELFSSPVLLQELLHTPRYPKFTARIGAFGANVAGLVEQYAALGTLVLPTRVKRVVATDLSAPRHARRFTPPPPPPPCPTHQSPACCPAA